MLSSEHMVRNSTMVAADVQPGLVGPFEFSA